MNAPEVQTPGLLLIRIACPRCNQTVLEYRGEVD